MCMWVGEVGNFPWHEVEKKRGDHACTDFLFIDCRNSFYVHSKN